VLADAFAFFRVGRKPQCVPSHRDLPAPDAEKTTEVDDCRADLSASIDNDIDDTPHILISAAADFSAENALDLLMIENRYGRLSQRAALDRVFLRRPGSLLPQGIALSG